MLASVTTQAGDLVVVNAVASHFITVAAAVSNDYLTSKIQEDGVNVGNNAITNLSSTSTRTSGVLSYQRIATATTYNFTLACTRSANSDGSIFWGSGSCVISVQVYRKPT
jgi:hypothetical protein